MKNILAVSIAALLFFSLLLTGCAGNFSSIKENVTVKDDLALRGSCIIAGTVINSSTNEPIRDANIVVFSKPTSTITDLYGQFEIIDMLPGTYTLQIFCAGYVPRDFPDITAKPDRLIRLNIKLEPKPDNN